MTKSRKVSLNEFYQTTPGATPIETLPSKPGQTARINDLSKELTDLGFNGKFGGHRTGYGASGDVYSSNGRSVGYGQAYGPGRGEWGHQHPDHPPPSRYDQDDGCAYRTHSGLHRDTDRDYSHGPHGDPRPYGPYAGPMPPPPPPRRQQPAAAAIANVPEQAKPAPVVHAAVSAAASTKAVPIPAMAASSGPKQVSVLQDAPGKGVLSAPPQQANSPQNEWAEKMAQAAMAKLNNAGIKSSLLSMSSGETGSPASESLMPNLQSKLRPTAMEPPRPDVQPADDRSPLAEDPQRPRLNLLPRTKPAVEDLPAGNAIATMGTAPPATATSGGRPKLNLLPRSKPPSGPSDGEPAAQKPSIFGAARPREEVLKQRGVDPILADLDSERHHYAQPHPADYVRSSRAASVTSGFSDESDQWQTVSNGRARVPSGRPDSGAGHFDNVDPFFGSVGTGSYTAARNVPAPRAFNGSGYDYGYNSGRDATGGRSFYGSYGSPAKKEFGGGAGYASYGAGDDDESSFFKRSLPTRHDLI